MRVLVVGAGPGGSITGYLLAEKGFDVTIVERKSEPEKPVICGEFFPDKELAGQFIPKGEALDLSYKFLREEHIMAKHSGMEIEFEGVSKISKLGVYIIDRHAFVGEIIKAALEQGAELLTKTSFIGGHMNNGKITAKLRRSNNVLTEEFDYIIGADAYPSLVAKSFGLPHQLPRNDVAQTITVRMKNVDYNNGLIYLLFSPEIAPRAYAWIFPSKNFYNVGVGLILEDKNMSMQYYLKKFLESKTYFKDAKIVSQYLGKPLPVGGINPKPAKEKVILVGDAAWLVVPTNGGGINNALVSGILAAKSIAHNSEDAHEIYLRNLRDILGSLLDRSLKYRRGVEKIYKHWKFFKYLAKISPASWILCVVLGKKCFAGKVLKMLA